jgi:hypothetical protein
MSARGLRIGEPAHRKAIEEAFLNYRVHHRTLVAPEAQYFADIGKSDQYVVRYFEVLRNLRLYGAGPCASHRAFVIVGPAWLEELLVMRAKSFWWPADRSKIVAQLEGLSADTNFVFDTDLMPGWLAGKGLVTQGECLKSS